MLKDSEIINDLRILAQGVSQNLCNLIIEVLILVVYPLLNYAASNLCVVIVKGKEFTTVLGNSYMDVGQHGVFFIWRLCWKLLSHLFDKALNLLNCHLLCYFHNLSVFVPRHSRCCWLSCFLQRYTKNDINKEDGEKIIKKTIFYPFISVFFSVFMV